MFVADNSLPTGFQNGDVHEWLNINLGDDLARRGGRWKTNFGVSLLVLWLNRNEFTFRGSRVHSGAVGRKILCIVEAIH